MTLLEGRTVAGYLLAASILLDVFWFDGRMAVVDTVIKLVAFSAIFTPEGD